MLSQVPLAGEWTAERAKKWWNQNFPEKSSTIP
jgi:hypothetical protein